MNDTETKALSALWRHGFLWTNPVDDDYHTTPEIAKKLALKGWAVFVKPHTRKCVGKIALTDNGMVEALMHRMQEVSK